MQVIPNEIPVVVESSTYNWSNVRIQFSNMNLPLIGITSISYSSSREKELVYGSGSEPIAISHGNVQYEGNVKLYFDEVKRLQDAVPKGDITLLEPFDIIV